MARTEWVDLPTEVHHAVAARTGRIGGVRPVADGLTCAMAARLETASGLVFVKGVPAADADGRAAQDWETVIAPLVGAVSPALRFSLSAAGWELLGFDWVDGRHADLAAGAADLPLVAAVLAVAQAVRVPDGLRVPLLAGRLAPYLETGEAGLLAGESLLHTDTNPHNLLAGADRAWMIDWAMPAAGPAWVDVAYTTVRLMEADTPADAALGWADQFTVWREADPRAVAAFVAGTCRQWEATVGATGSRPSNRRFEVLLNVVRA